MTSWDEEELSAIAASDDLHISALREDGVTFGTLTWIWSVVVDGNLYVRPYSGPSSRWYRSAIAQKAGRIRAAGVVHHVTFAPADPAVFDAVDAAYWAKYASSPYLPPMLQPGPRSATLRITPAG